MSDLTLLTAQQTAALIQVDPSTVYRLVRDGRLAGIRFGRNVRIRPVDLERFLDQHRASRVTKLEFRYKNRE